MAKRKEYQIDELARLLSDPSLNADAKRGIFADWCVNEAGMPVDPITGVIDKKELAYLWKDLNKEISKICGQDATKARSLKLYLDSYKSNFLEEPTIKALDEDKKKAIFEFFTKKKRSYVGDAEVEKGIEKVDEIYNNANGIAKTRVTSLPAISADDIISGVDAYNEVANARNDFKRVKSDVVTDGVGVYQSMTILQEEYEAYASVHGRIDEIETFFNRYDGMIDEPSVGHRIWKHGKTLAESMEYQVGIKHRITKTEVNGMLSLLRTRVKGGGGPGPDPDTHTDPDTHLPVGREFPIPKRGFFQRLGRWALRHVGLAGTILAGVVVGVSAIISPLFVLSAIAPIIVATGTAIATSFGGAGIVRAVSPAYKNFIYDYDIEQSFKKVKSNRAKAEVLLDRVESVIGAEKFNEIKNASTDAEKTTIINDLRTADSTKVDEVVRIINKNRRKVNSAERKSNKGIQKIQDYMGKKMSNDATMGYNDTERRARSENIREGVAYETDKKTTNRKDFNDADRVR